MKAGFRKVVFEVRVGIAVIATRRCGVEKLPGEHSSITKSKVQSFIQLVFGNQIEFVADMAAGTGVCGNRNRAAAGIEVVI